jgi:hypothetical protein
MTNGLMSRVRNPDIRNYLRSAGVQVFGHLALPFAAEDA